MREFLRSTGNFLNRYRWISQWIVTIVVLVFIYKATNAIIAYVTAPKIVMTMSAISGRVAVAAEPAKLAPIMRTVTYTGSISPYEEVAVYPRVEGWVQTFNLYEGDRVKKGELVARLDRAELTAMVESKQAMIAQVEWELSAAKASLTGAQANLEFWEKEIARFDTLFKNNAIAESELDNAKKQYQLAKAHIEEIKSKITMIEQKIAGARADLGRSRTVLGYTDLFAPLTGRVSKRHIYAGILVKPNMPIIDIQDLSRVRVQIRVAEKDIPLAKVGTEAIVRFPALPSPHDQRRATVSTIFPQLDPVTRTTTVEMILDNQGEMIKPDMYAVVDLILEKKENAVTIPRLAVLNSDHGQPGVYVTDGVMAFFKPVKVGIAEGNRIEILDGIKEGEMVISKGNRNLTNGQQVSLVAGF